MNKERILMFTAMQIMEIFDDIQTDVITDIELLSLFADWSEEFYKLHKNDFDKEDFDVIESVDYFAQQKIMKQFNIDESQI